MGYLVGLVGVVVLFCLLLFLSPLLGALLGAWSGYVVGLLFGDTILGILAALGLKGFAMWQIGAFLGFVGMFFRSMTNLSSKKG